MLVGNRTDSALAFKHGDVVLLLGLCSLDMFRDGLLNHCCSLLLGADADFRSSASFSLPKFKSGRRFIHYLSSVRLEGGLDWQLG